MKAPAVQERWVWLDSQEQCFSNQTSLTSVCRINTPWGSPLGWGLGCPLHPTHLSSAQEGSTQA